MSSKQIEQFRKQLRQATMQAFASIKDNIGELYGFSLVLDALGSTIGAAGQSTPNLEKWVAKECQYWSADGGTTRDLVSCMCKWSLDGWIASDSEFEEVNAILMNHLTSVEGEAHQADTRLVFACCVSTLAELDLEGVFGIETERRRIVLNLFPSSWNDDDAFYWANLINPYDVRRRYTEEMEEARRAAARLTYKG